MKPENFFSLAFKPTSKLGVGEADLPARATLFVGSTRHPILVGAFQSV
jgi:hypothetical protein